MTRVCCYCKTVMGEKCGECGELDVIESLDRAVIAKTLSGLNQDSVTPFFTCPSCGHQWFKGQEPITMGICRECYPKGFVQMVIFV